MRRSYFFLTTIILVLSLATLASAQNEYKSTEEFLKTILSDQARLDLEAKGDLNNDGLADWTGLIHRENPDSSPTYQLYVLLQGSDGSYRLGEKTIEGEIPGMGCCWVEDLRIERGSIFIQNNAKTAATMDAATHQFKWYKGQWRLVGLRIYYLDHSTDVATDTDMNILTGAVIEKRQKGDGKKTSRRSRKKFAISLLKDFDFLNGFGIE